LFDTAQYFDISLIHEHPLSLKEEISPDDSITVADSSHNLPSNSLIIPVKTRHTEAGAFVHWKSNSNYIVNNNHGILPAIPDGSGFHIGTTNMPRKICSNCGSISTPSWRRCPEGKSLLCNACGLYQKLHKRPRPLRIREDGSVQVIRNATMLKNVCQNCKTTETTIWRRSAHDKNLLLCNECAFYLRATAMAPVTTAANLCTWTDFTFDGEYFEKL